ncbi:Putative flippase GtrA (transmembrane translocase of bactoprenol-linked glucose) [Pedobacter suwonensis]|uniref:Putative flippase GtrA (Transmembrane translocase of bactoprenol-linked glucose) n=1 Tax=Pedobacter suwonensis TaxID=332999 RepID=A0A1I0TQX3_9SPHI|nr:GtrA family protein [Pedobacter suwonensis]SFA54148.1 Putative flippase GtrA (transmembrane translocase of bactoprenol-linked glucose) [Pedobacter suwonensis]
MKSKSKNHFFIIKMIRFGTVGFSGLLLDFSVTYVLKDTFFVNPYLSSAIGFIVAATSNYFLNRIWTFESANKNIIPQFISFFSIAVLGLVLNSFCIMLFTHLDIQFYYSKALAVFVVFFWNFAANFFLTFKERKKLAHLKLAKPNVHKSI